MSQHPPEQGFFARTPRIIRTGYKKLSHTEKWLYVCLKDLCGDTGTCYRSLRSLSQETDISIGLLSTGVRKLHEAGLIHAEKKRRDNNPTGKEVWHISIVDIWEANAKECSASEPNVQLVNDNINKCSASEQQCSKSGDKELTVRTNSNEEEQREEREARPAQPAHVEKKETQTPLSQEKLISEETHLNPKQQMGRRVSACFQVLEATKKEALKDTRACYAETKADAKRLEDLINAHRGKPSEVNPVRIKSAWLELWNRADKGGFKWWQVPGRLTVNAFCENYGSAMDAVLFAERVKAREEEKQAVPDVGHMSEEEYQKWLRRA